MIIHDVRIFRLRCHLQSNYSTVRYTRTEFCSLASQTLSPPLSCYVRAKGGERVWENCLEQVVCTIQGRIQGGGGGGGGGFRGSAEPPSKLMIFMTMPLKK